MTLSQLGRERTVKIKVQETAKKSKPESDKGKGTFLPEQGTVDEKPKKILKASQKGGDSVSLHNNGDTLSIKRKRDAGLTIMKLPG